MSLNGMIGEFSTVIKVDVSDIENSLWWYSEKLGLEYEKLFSGGNWQQLKVPGRNDLSIGLLPSSNGAVIGTKKATFVVENIETSRDALLQNGVEVGEIEMIGEWVKLAFFKDPDGNVFGLRQNL